MPPEGRKRGEEESLTGFTTTTIREEQLSPGECYKVTILTTIGFQIRGALGISKQNFFEESFTSSIVYLV